MRHLLLLLLVLIPELQGRAETVSPLWSRGFAALPEPQQVALESSDIRFGPDWSLAIGEGIPTTDVAVETIDEELRSRSGLRRSDGTGTAVRLEMRPGSVAPGQAKDADKTAIAAQAYRIEIRPGSVAIKANAPEGLFYGVETFAGLLKQRDGNFYLPQGTITDWPDLHLRHVYWDDAHHLERLVDLKRAVRQAAAFKINGFAIKLEGHFQFASAPALVEPYALSPAEYQELTNYGLRYHVQVIPYLDAPAHIAFILKHPEYAKYRAFADSNYELCTVNPDAVKMLSAMFQDLLNANRGGKFVYLSTDEAYYIGLSDSQQCNEKAALKNKGTVGRLLADFIAQVAAPMHNQGRTVIFWGEYPLIASDIAALPPYLVNGEVYGPEFDPLFRQRGIRQMIYTSTQGEERMFPEYFRLPNSRRLHPVALQTGRIEESVRKISYDPARTQSDLIGAVVAGWADMGLHPETFWLGYATIAAAGWHPGSPPVEETMAAFYRLYYGDDAVGLGRVYQLMSQQAQFWFDSWESGPSPRKPIFGYSGGIYRPRRPVEDQTLTLPPAPGPDLRFDAKWGVDNRRRLQLASEFLTENDELLGRLFDQVYGVDRNRYTLEVFASIARLYRQNLEMLLDIGGMCQSLESAGKAAAAQKPKDAIESLDSALELAREIRRQRNAALHDATATWYQSWYPRVTEANGRRFLHELDDVKDHLPDRTADMSYLVYRELNLPFGEWVEAIRAVRNRFAAAHRLPLDNQHFDWLDTGVPPEK
jgi:hexosaminidase